MGTQKETERPQNKNLKPWKPGESGNPNGRPPKGYSITDAFQKMLGADPETKASIVNAIKEKALKGDVTAQKLIWNYMDGMPQQDIDVTSGGEQIGTADAVIAAISSAKK